jgi:hypothetical protein
MDRTFIFVISSNLYRCSVVSGRSDTAPRGVALGKTPLTGSLLPFEWPKFSALGTSPAQRSLRPRVSRSSHAAHL